MAKAQSGLLSGGVPFIRGGEGPRHAVIFFGANALLWRLDKVRERHRFAREVARALPAGFRFTVLGYPEFPPENYTLDTVVDDFARVFPSETGPADLVIGISFGGFAALRFAARFPERVSRLVLLVTAHRFGDNGKAILDRQMALLEAGDRYSVIRENAPLFRRRWYNWLMRLMIWRERDRLLAQMKDPDVVLAAFRSLFYTDNFSRNRAFAERIRVPTLLIGGTRDQYFGTAPFRETAEAIPDCRLELLEGEAHLLPIERSRSVRAFIAEFVR